MDLVIPLRKRETEEAQALLTKLRLRDISLYRCEIEGDGSLSRRAEPIPLLDSEIDSELSHKDASGLDFAVTLRITCDEPAFHIHITFLARYLFADGVRTASRTEVEAFRKSHAVLTVWPYLREFVQTVTVRMGFQTEPLPLARLVTRSR